MFGETNQLVPNQILSETKTCLLLHCAILLLISQSGIKNVFNSEVRIVLRILGILNVLQEREQDILLLLSKLYITGFLNTWHGCLTGSFKGWSADVLSRKNSRAAQQRRPSWPSSHSNISLIGIDQRGGCPILWGHSMNTWWAWDTSFLRHWSNSFILVPTCPLWLL